MAQITTINKHDELFPESFRAIGEECPERIYAMSSSGRMSCSQRNYAYRSLCPEVWKED